MGILNISFINRISKLRNIFKGLKTTQGRVPVPNELQYKTLTEDVFVSSKKQSEVLENVESDFIETGFFSDINLFGFAKKHSFLNPDGSIAEDGLALCRMDKHLPTDGKILTWRERIMAEKGINGVRDSLHFSVNGAVEKHIGGNWNELPYLYILPFKETENVVGGSAIDIITKGSVRLPRGAVLVRQNKTLPCGKYQILNLDKFKEFKELKAQGVIVIETSSSPHEAANDVIKAMGYDIKPGGELFGLGDKVNKKFVEIMKKNGKFLAFHTNTPNAKVEQMIDFINFRNYTQNKSWKATEDITSYVPTELLAGNEQAMKNIEGKTILQLDYQDEYIKLLDYIEEYAERTKLPLDFDTKKLKEIIKISETPQIAVDRIKSEMNLLPNDPNYNTITELSFFSSSRNVIGSPNDAGKKLDEILFEIANGKRDLESSEKLIKTLYNDSMI